MDDRQREAIRRSECKTDKEFTELVRRRLAIAAPTTQWWIKMLNGKAYALYLGFNHKRPIEKLGYTYIRAERFVDYRR